MSSAPRTTHALPALVLAAALFGCEQPKETAPATTTPSAPPEPTAAATPTPTAKPSATVSEAKPSHPCPEGTNGEGTFSKPCVAKGTTRIMDVAWTGKTDDKGPYFRVTNNSKLEILYGQIVVYFYDKDGKQLELPPAEGSKKPRHYQLCGGNIFAGPMKAGEKAVLTFSCVKKAVVPEGTTAIEAEMRMVGFTGEEGNRADTYWRNDDLTPTERPKGGIK